MSGLFESVSVAWVSLTAITWLCVALFAPRLAGADPSTSASSRIWTARAWIYAPLWVPLALICAAFTPGLVGALLSSGDHCLSHGHHHHLCLLHPPQHTGGALFWAAPVTLLAAAALALIPGARRLVSQRRLARALLSVSRGSSLGHDVRLLDHPEPMALAVGCKAPRIMISTGLMERASQHTLDAILAHERAHIERKDVAFAIADRLAAALLPPAIAAALLEGLALACEQACDERAADLTGGPVRMARALTEVARLNMTIPDAGLSVASGQFEARILYLLGPPRRGGNRPIAAALAAGIVAAGAGPIHTAIEHLLNHLLH